MTFLNELNKFFGGLVGDERTNAGVAINRASDSEVARGTLHVPYTYTMDGKKYNGALMVPRSSIGGINKTLSENKNSEAISLAGIELDDGNSLS